MTFATYSAIAFIVNLHENHDVPLQQAYQHGLGQFRTLRAEHETANRSAMLEAKAHGAVFFGEIERGLMVEERVLDEWVNAKAIQDRIASGQTSGPAVSGPTSPPPPSSSARSDGLFSGNSSFAGMILPEQTQGEVEFTGGEAYAKRFRDSLQSPPAATERVSNA